MCDINDLTDVDARVGMTKSLSGRKYILSQVLKDNQGKPVRVQKNDKTRRGHLASNRGLPHLSEDGMWCPRPCNY